VSVDHSGLNGCMPHPILYTPDIHTTLRQS
jgi:hypothetical protein